MTNCLKIGGRLLSSDQMIAALVRYKLLEPLVGQLLLDEVFEEVPLLKQEVFHALTGQANAPIPENFEGFLAQWCEQKGVTMDYFYTVIMRDWQLQKFKQLRFAPQAESEFMRIKADLDQVEYSLIQLNDLSLAQEVYFQIRDDGVDFAQLAREHSLGSERVAGGLIGPVSLSALPDNIATLFRHQQAGMVYPPVVVGNRYWVVRLERFIAARLTESTLTEVIDRLYNQWLKTQVQTVMNTPGAIAVHATPTEQTQRRESPSLAMA
jgi:parvulin-like peptidyl-prolyl isomerase